MELNKVTVARILIDSIIDRQDLLRTGDVILEANGKKIKTPEQLQTAIEDSGAFVVFKILPSNVDQQEIDSSLPKAGKVAKVTIKGLSTEKRVYTHHAEGLVNPKVRAGY
jgi:membrane-associated protease RseP (regulator of RpoE activity)